MSELVTLTTVGNELEAEKVCGLLRTEGIEAAQRGDSLGPGILGGGGAWHVLVRAQDLERARELITPPAEA